MTVPESSTTSGSFIKLSLSSDISDCQHMIGILKINFDCKIREQIKMWIFTHFNKLLATVCCQAELNAGPNLGILGLSLTMIISYAGSWLQRATLSFLERHVSPQGSPHFAKVAPSDPGDPATLPTVQTSELPA